MNTLHLNQIGDKVIVKKGEGGGGSEGGSASEWRYMDLRTVSNASMRKYMLNFGHVVNFTANGQTFIGSTFLTTTMLDVTTINALAVNMSAYMKDNFTGMELMTVKEFFSQEQDGINSWDGILAQIGATEITEEEFLNIQ